MPQMNLACTSHIRALLPLELRAHLAKARKPGERRDSIDIDLAAHQLPVLIDGLSAQRVLYPSRVTAARQRQMLGELLDRFRPWPG